MPLDRFLLLVVSLLTLCSCAALRPDATEIPNPPPAQAESAQVPNDVLAQVETDLDPNLMFALLVGELAGQRGDLNMAVHAYVEAARKSEDAAVAERAVQIALFAKNLDAAERALDILLETQPDEALTHRLALSVYLREGNAEKALQHAQRLLESADAPERSTLLAMASFLVRESQQDMAITVMKGLVAQSQDKAGANYALSQVARHYQNAELAELSAAEAIKLDPAWPAPYVQLAAIYDQSDRLPQALALLEKMAPKHDDRALLMAYGQLLAKADRIDLAANQFQRVLNLNPDDHAARMALALARLQQQQYSEAQMLLNALVDVEAFHDRAAFYLGRIARKNNLVDESIRWFESVGQGSVYVESQTNIAILKAQQGDLVAARAVFNGLREQFPDQAAQFYLLEGEVLYETEAFTEFYRLMNTAVKAFPEDMKLRYSRALAAVEVDHLEILESDLRLVLSKSPNDVDALNALGYSLASETERFEEASQFLEKALELRPEDPAILDSVGWLRYRQGQYELALEFLQRAYDKYQDDEIAAHLGEVLWTLGKKQAARDLWRKAHQAKPNSRHLREVLERFK